MASNPLAVDDRGTAIGLSSLSTTQLLAQCIVNLLPQFPQLRRARRDGKRSNSETRWAVAATGSQCDSHTKSHSCSVVGKYAAADQTAGWLQHRSRSIATARRSNRWDTVGHRAVREHPCYRNTTRGWSRTFFIDLLQSEFANSRKRLEGTPTFKRLNFSQWFSLLARTLAACAATARSAVAGVTTAFQNTQRFPVPPSALCILHFEL